MATGKLDEYRVRDEWFRWKNIAKSFGCPRLNQFLQPRIRGEPLDQFLDFLRL